MQHGSIELYRRVRGALIANGSSLNKWCQDNGVTRQWVELAVKGKRKGPAAQRIVKQIADLIDEIS